MRRDKKQIFISYSRKDKNFADNLTQDLQDAGLVVWRDMENLVAGTANWERAIRQAIKDAAAVVLVASPFALTSEFVQGELAVAKLYQCPIYPIWATGNNWLDCIPLDMSKLQYIDGRGEIYKTGLSQLVQALEQLFDESKGIVTVGLPTHETFGLNLGMFTDFGSFLDRVYMFRLESWYEAFTYGRDWVLGNVQTKQLALPWEWFAVPPGDTIYNFDPSYSDDPVSDYGILPQSYWGIWDITRFDVIGIAANTSSLIQRILSEESTLEIVRLFRDNHLRLSTTTEIMREVRQ